MTAPAQRRASAVSALLQRALALHQRGDLNDASSLYREILAREPRNVDALYLDGLVAHQQGRYADAERRYTAALRVNDALPVLHTALGNTHREGKNTAAALACYETALKLAPGDAEALYNLGIAHHEADDMPAAAVAYRRAVEANPRHAECWNNLGVALKALGQSAEALACYDKVIALEAAHAMAHFNRGVLLADAGRYEDAMTAYGRALQAAPSYVEAIFNMGIVCKNLGRSDEARRYFMQALALRPDHAGALQNLGALAYEAGRLDEAETHYKRSLAVADDNPAVRYNLSLIHLARGDYQHGWREFEWRWAGAESSRVHRRVFPQPQWHGEDIAGRTILLHAEQGLGDTLQFVRYAPLVAARGARVIVECQPPLARLLHSVSGIAQLVCAGEALPAFDCHCPLMSLPLACGTMLDTVPAATPYLHADAGDITAWRARLTPASAPKVGLAWAGNPRAFSVDLNLIDRRRSLHLRQLAPLSAAGGVFYSLQLGDAAAQLRDTPELPVVDLTAHIRDFADTAALVANLDLIVTVDTSVAHLAGAMGKPVWLLSRYDACWRWLRERDDSPWYPTLRIFRQPAPGRWDAAVRQVAAELARHRGEFKP